MVAVATPAAQHTVDGLLLPRAIAGHPGLELCNTVAGWGGTAPRDYLESYPHVVALARSLGLLPAADARALLRASYDDPRLADRVLADTRLLRGDLYRVLSRSHDAGQLDRLNVALAGAAAARRIETVTAHGPRWGFAGPAGLQRPLDLLAWESRRLLEAPGTASRVRCCPGDGCGWLFVDPRGQRRWCVMSLCGNRAKARRHAARTRDLPGPVG